MRQNLQLIALLALVTGLAVMARGHMDLYERLGALDDRLLIVDAIRTGIPRYAVEDAATMPAVPQNPVAAAVPSAPARAEPAAVARPVAPASAAVSVPAMALEATERGYMYAQEWADMEYRLAAMSKDDNKAFWGEMFRAIEAGELEVYDE